MHRQVGPLLMQNQEEREEEQEGRSLAKYEVQVRAAVRLLREEEQEGRSLAKYEVQVRAAVRLLLLSPLRLVRQSLPGQETSEPRLRFQTKS